MYDYPSISYMGMSEHDLYPKKGNFNWQEMIKHQTFGYKPTLFSVNPFSASVNWWKGWSRTSESTDVISAGDSNLGNFVSSNPRNAGRIGRNPG